MTKVLLAVVAACPPACAYAESGGTIGVGAKSDDNVFRQPDGTSTLLGPRADRIYSVHGDGDAEFNVADLDVSLVGDAAYNKYQNNSEFNNFNYSLQGGVNRMPGAAIGFQLSVLSRRQLSSFADIYQAQRNIQQFTDVSARVTVPIIGDVNFVVTPDFTSNINTSAVIRPTDYNRYGGGVGIGYYSPLGNSLELTVSRHQTDGLSTRLASIDGVTSDQRINLADTSADLKVVYAISPLTSVTGRFSYLWRQDKTLLHHSINSPIGELTVDYHPRESFSISATVGQQLGTLDSLYVDSERDTYAQGAFKMRLVNRLDLDLHGTYDRRVFVADSSNSTVSGAGRTENIYRVEGGLGYRLFDRLTLGVSYAHEVRTSTLSTVDYSANVAQITISVLLGNKVLL